MSRILAVITNTHTPQHRPEYDSIGNGQVCKVNGSHVFRVTDGGGKVIGYGRDDHHSSSVLFTGSVDVCINKPSEPNNSRTRTKSEQSFTIYHYCLKHGQIGVRKNFPMN